MSDQFSPDPSFTSRDGYESGTDSVPPPAPGAYGPSPMQGMYGQATYGMMSPPKSTNGYAIASMIIGIISIPMCYIGFITGIVAMSLGVVGLKQIKAEPDRFEGRGMAIAGIATSAVAMLIWGGMSLFFFLVGLADT